MAAQVHAESVEGNDVWLVWRVTLPDGTTLIQSSLDQSSGGDDPNEMTVSIIHESSLGNSKKVIQIFQGDASGTAPGGDPNYMVHTSLQTDLWGGLDDIGYTVEVRIPAAGTDYILEGGNKYAVEVALITDDWGTVLVAATLQVEALHSV